MNICCSVGGVKCLGPEDAHGIPPLFDGGDDGNDDDEDDD